MLFLSLKIFENSLSEKTKYMVIGNLIIIFLVVIVLCNLIVGFIETIIRFKEFYVYMRDWKYGKKTNKIADKKTEGDKNKSKKEKEKKEGKRRNNKVKKLRKKSETKKVSDLNESELGLNKSNIGASNIT